MGQGQSEARGTVNARDGGALAIYRQAKADLARDGNLSGNTGQDDRIERAFLREGMDVGVPNPNACPTCGYAFADGRPTPDCILA
jgi:hypothetical protein